MTVKTDRIGTHACSSTAAKIRLRVPASGCCISWLVQHGLARSGEWTAIEQGIEIKRPSLIRTRATKSGSGIRDVLVSGRTIPVATGSFFLP